MITPAISVLSAVEGLALLDPRFADLVLPTTLGIVAAVFAIQRRGTARVGRLFGPIMVLWFGTLAALGVRAIAAAPEVLFAVSPSYAAGFLATHPGVALTILGAVFLVLMGSEALYADMGHFGKQPVRVAWLGLVLAGVVAQLLRAGRLAVDGRGPDRESVFRARCPPSGCPARPGFKDQVFAHLQRRSAQAAEFFRMPTRRVVMLATEIDI